MIHLLAQDAISQEFVKYLLAGMGVAVLGLAGVCYLLIKYILAKSELTSVALAKSAEAMEDVTEVLRETRELNHRRQK